MQYTNLFTVVLHILLHHYLDFYCKPLQTLKPKRNSDERNTPQKKGKEKPPAGPTRTPYSSILEMAGRPITEKIAPSFAVLIQTMAL